MIFRTIDKYILLFLVLNFTLVNGQIGDSSLKDQLVGYWEGAFIKETSFQQIQMEITEKEGKLYSFQIMEDWHPGFGEFEIPLSIDSLQNIVLNTGYGKAILQLDNLNNEMNGSVEGDVPGLKVHFKKAPPRPEMDYALESVSVENGEVTLKGHLHITKANPKKTAVILLGGRGCYPDATPYNLYAKFLRKYGISALAFQKRGTGESTGNCDKASIADLASDVVALREYLMNHPNHYEKVGIIGVSAGGWVMLKAEEMADFDFLISIVGPSTSVYDQQMQSMEYGAKFYGLSEKATNNARDYTRLMFEAPASDEGFRSFTNLLNTAETEGWFNLLENTDIPGDAEGIADLWVRRHAFDPKDVLSTFQQPYMGIYGELDWIVPAEENIELLNNYFKGDRINLLSVYLAHNADHGMEMQGKNVRLKDGSTYWRFYRISSDVRIRILEFLDKHGLR